MPQAEGRPWAQQLEPPSLSVSVTVPHKFNGTMQLHYLKSHNICWYDSFITVNLYIYLLIKKVILGDTSSLLGNNCPMLYILYMLYKQSKICKSKCSVDSMAPPAGGDWDQARPLVGPPRLGRGGPSRVTILLGPGHGLGQDLATVQGQSLRLPRCFSPHEGERGRLWEQERPHSTSLPGHSTGPGMAGSIGNSQRSTPGVSHLLPREDTPQPPPSTTSLSLRGPRETIPCGKTAGDSRDWLRASGFSSSFPRQSQLPSLVCFTAAMSCALLTRHTLLENLFHIFRGINLQLLKLLDTVVVA